MRKQLARIIKSNCRKHRFCKEDFTFLSDCDMVWPVIEYMLKGKVLVGNVEDIYASSSKKSNFEFHKLFNKLKRSGANIGRRGLLFHHVIWKQAIKDIMKQDYDFNFVELSTIDNTPSEEKDVKESKLKNRKSQTEAINVHLKAKKSKQKKQIKNQKSLDKNIDHRKEMARLFYQEQTRSGSIDENVKKQEQQVLKEGKDNDMKQKIENNKMVKERLRVEIDKNIINDIRKNNKKEASRNSGNKLDISNKEIKDVGKIEIKTDNKNQSIKNLQNLVKNTAKAQGSIRATKKFQHMNEVNKQSRSSGSNKNKDGGRNFSM